MSEIKKDWESILTKESYLVTREGATERPFSGEYWDHFEDGYYKCICCGTELFKSNSKFYKFGKFLYLPKKSRTAYKRRLSFI